MEVTMYRNLDCGTSRNVLALIHHVGIHPTKIEYLKTPNWEKFKNPSFAWGYLFAT